MTSPRLSPSARARAWLAWIFLFVLSLLLLQWLWRPLAWGALLALGLSPLHNRFSMVLRASDEGSWRHHAVTALFCVLTGMAVLSPLGLLGGLLTEQISRLAALVNAWVAQGASIPDWVLNLPAIGPWLSRHWQSAIPGEGVGAFLAGKLDPAEMARLAASLGLGVLARAIEAPLILVGLFFALTAKRRLRERLEELHADVFETPGNELLDQLSAAGRSVFSGVVILGMAEGTLFWAAFALAGTPAPALFGFAAGFGAALPLVGPLVCTAAVVFVWVALAHAQAVGLMLFCMLMLFVLDPLTRARISSSQPGGPRSIWLYGAFLGGFAQFGLIGLFVGPMAVSACLYYWRLARQGKGEPLTAPTPTPAASDDLSPLKPRGAFGPVVDLMDPPATEQQVDASVPGVGP